MIHERPRIVVVGLGNSHRGDDGVGLLLARKIAERNPSGTRVVFDLASNVDILDAWMGADIAIIVDAMFLGKAQAGLVRRFDHLDELDEKGVSGFSSHGLSVGSIWALARELRQLPQRVIVFGIAGQCFAEGKPLSPSVVTAAEKALVLILKEIESLVAGNAIPGRSQL